MKYILFLTENLEIFPLLSYTQWRYSTETVHFIPIYVSVYW